MVKLLQVTTNIQNSNLIKIFKSLIISKCSFKFFAVA